MSKQFRRLERSDSRWRLPGATESVTLLVAANVATPLWEWLRLFRRFELAGMVEGSLRESRFQPLIPLADHAD